jgi:hypothetical protein
MMPSVAGLRGHLIRDRVASRVQRLLFQLKPHRANATQAFDWTEHQKALGRLPLPTLEQTLGSFLEYVHPLLSAEEFSETEKAVKAFQNGEGAALQSELCRIDSESPATSYVKGFWDDMYLGGRYPVPINSNPGLLIRDDASKLTQASRAASLVFYSLKWIQGERRGLIKPDFQGSNAQCMQEYASLFSLTRIPQPGRDRHAKFDDSRHIVVIRGQQFFALEVFDEAGGIISEGALQAQVELILAQGCTSGGASASECLGTFTCGDRDEWAAARSELLSHNASVNGKSLHAVDSALFVVTLDYGDCAPDGDLTAWLNYALHGCGNHRWFDKSFQINVAENGRACVNFEHSPFDGKTIVRFLDDVWHDAQGLAMPSGTPSFEALHAAPASFGSGAADCAPALAWDYAPRTAAALAHAAQGWERLVNANQTVGLDFKHFGKAEIKRWKQSPDGCIQLAFQLAYFRLHGSSRISVYESWYEAARAPLPSPV